MCKKRHIVYIYFSAERFGVLNVAWTNTPTVPVRKNATTIVKKTFQGNQEVVLGGKKNYDNKKTKKKPQGSDWGCCFHEEIIFGGVFALNEQIDS